MKAAVLEQIGQPLKIVDLEIPELEAGQVLVKVLCAGICGSQLQEIDGLKGDPAHCPHLLGHEGCGIIEAIGLGLKPICRGQKVVMHWRKGSGMESAFPIYNRRFKSGLITTFSQYAIVSENRITVIPDDVPNDLACLLGCALSTALAIIENEITNDQRILVIGCGGVGLALIFASRLISSFAGGVDRVESKRDLVESFGAQFGTWVTPQVVADVVIDTIGCGHTIACSKYISLQPGGTSGGGFNPDKDIPRYVQMWRDGKLDGWEKLITHKIPLDGINRGIQLMREGRAARVLIDMR